jgi:hypothetical protein
LIGRAGSGDGKHAGVQVETDNIPGRANPLCSESGDYAGAASNVQDALTGARVGQRYHLRCPGREHGGNQCALIGLSGISSHLPLTLVTHDRLRGASMLSAERCQ